MAGDFCRPLFTKDKIVMMFVKDKVKSRKPRENETEITYVNEDVQIIGCFAVPHNLVLLGNIKGDVVVKGDLIIAKTAAVIGNVWCKSATIDGILNGNISCEKKLTVNEGGQILGDITAEDFLSYGKVNFAGKINISNNGAKMNEEFENIVSKMLHDAGDRKKETKQHENQGTNSSFSGFGSVSANDRSLRNVITEKRDTTPATEKAVNAQDNGDASKSNPWI